MPRYEYECLDCGERITSTFKIGYAPDSQAVIHRDPKSCGFGDRECCVYQRVLSSFSGRFGDTEKFHG